MDKQVSKVDKLLKKIVHKPAPKESEYAFKFPAFVQVAGMTGTGKSYFVVKYLLSYGLQQYDQVIWCCPARSINQPIFRPLKEKYGEYITFVECDNGINQGEVEELIGKGKDSNWKTCIVLDDLLDQQRSPYIRNLYCHSRHMGVVAIFSLCQSIKVGNKTNRLNSNGYVLFRFSENGPVDSLAKDLCSSKQSREKLVKAYSSIVNQNQNGCLILVLNTPSTVELPLRARHTEMDVLIPQLYRL